MKYEITSNGVLKNCVHEGETELIIPDGVTMIGEYAFRRWNAVEKIVIPEGVTIIREYAFEDCTSLVEIVLPSTLTLIRPGAFKKCSALKQIQFPKGLASIGKQGFAECNSLTEIVLPAGLKTFESAFENCKNLVSVTLEDGIALVSNKAFAGCTALKECHIPDSVKEIGADALPRKLIPKKKPKPVRFEDQNGVLLRYHEPDCDILDEKCGGCPFEEYLSDCEKPPAWSRISVPKTVTEIGKLSFEDCMSITSITIPEGVTKIGDLAFAGCLYLSKITIPESVTEIGDQVFAECSNLQTIAFVKNGKKVKLSFDAVGFQKSFCGDSDKRQMHFLTKFITEQDREKCEEIVQNFRNESVKEIFLKIMKKVY